ncbi:hypothetical protein KNHN1_14150 [Pseudomonas guariconensis]|uniref:FG-GAP repeat protein n=1 Tax=Pseudomonas guariconensis TaxID=1288410 RepID=UPI002DD758F1|nr:FG-GAP repeat protein [Pseudomonas aeruginosa]
MAQHLRRRKLCAHSMATALAVCLALSACGGGGGTGSPSRTDSPHAGSSEGNGHGMEGASAPQNSDRPTSETVYIKRGPASSDGSFGQQIAFSPDGSVLAVGHGTALELFTRRSGHWASAQVLAFEGGAAPVPAFASDGSLFVGLPGVDSGPVDAGQVKVFAVGAGGWTLAETWHTPSPVHHGRFGAALSVSADGLVAVVGEPGVFTPGRVHVYRRQGARWTREQIIEHPQAGSRFGAQAQLSADGSTLVVGAMFEDNGPSDDPADTRLRHAGAAYVFGFDSAAGAWRAQAYLKAPSPAAHQWFGAATAISGDGSTLVIGERFRDQGGWPGAGAAYVFHRSAAAYALTQTLDSPQPKATGHFGGHALALTQDGSVLAVGEIGDTSTGTGMGADPTQAGRSWAGATHLYRRHGARFVHANFVKASNTGQADLFGWALALTQDGSTLAVGAPAEASSSTGIGGDPLNNNQLHQGAVYVY